METNQEQFKENLLEQMANKIEPGQYDITFRQGTAIDLIEVKPDSFEHSGTIDSPFAYLEAKSKLVPISNEEKAKMLVIINTSPNDPSVKLKTNVVESGHVSSCEILGRFAKNPIISELGINSEKKWAPKELYRVIRKYPSIFQSLDDYNKFVPSLLSVSSNINTVLDTKNDNAGNTKDLIEKTCKTDLVKSIFLEIEVFPGLGFGKSKFRVDLFFEADASSVKIEFFSDELITATDIFKGQKLAAVESSFKEFGIPIVHV